jgi:multiple sugar transport system substrate-binding protein
MKETTAVSRRSFLRLAGIVSTGMFAAACMPAAPAATTGGQQAPSGTQSPIALWVALDAGELEPLTTLIQGYNKDHPEVLVTMEEQPFDGYSEKLITTIAGGTGPDLSFCHPLWVSVLADQQVSLPLDDLVAASPEFHPEDFVEQTSAYFVYKGKRYGFAHTSFPTVTYFNKTLFDKLGVPYPTTFQDGFDNDADKWTWDNVIELGQKLTTGEGPDQTFGLSTGYGVAPSSLSHLVQIIYSYGGEMWDEDYTKTRLNEPEALAAIQVQADLVTKYHIVPTPSQMEGVPGGVNSGRFGMWMWNRSEVPGFKTVDFELGMAPYPRGTKGRVLRDGPGAIIINRNSKVVDPAWAFAKWFVGPKPGELGGQSYQFEIQHSQPTRKSLFDNKVFLDNLLEWESRDVYEDAGNRVRAMAPPPRYTEIDAVWREQWDRIKLGDASVEEAVNTFADKANKLLQQKE